MASVDGNCPCRRCGFEDAFFIERGFYYTAFCSACGYVYREAPELDPDDRYKIDEENRVVINQTEEFNHGAYQIHYKSGCAEGGALTEPVSAERIEEFKRLLEDPDIDSESSFLSVWHETTKTTQVIVGRNPSRVS